MSNPPLVSILMPVRNEGAFIKRSLGAVLAQDYPAESLEVIVADGRSTDETAPYVSEIARQHSNVTLIENPQKIVSTGLNAALRIAKGEIIVRVDGHTVINPDYVRACVNALENSKADNVGGRMSAVGDKLFGRAVAAATSSRFGVGGARFHYSQKEEWVDTVYLGAWHSALFRRIGMFDEEMVRNQDDEFNYRLRASGGRIWLSPKIKSSYFNRATAGSLAKQYFQYGFWKVRVLQKHPGQMKLRQFVPALFVIALVILLVNAPIFLVSKVLLSALLLAYTLASIMASVFAARKFGWRLFPQLPIVFAIVHLAYGSGFIFGLLKFRNRWRFSNRAPQFERPHDTAPVQ